MPNDQSLPKAEISHTEVLTLRPGVGRRSARVLYPTELSGMGRVVVFIGVLPQKQSLHMCLCEFLECVHFASSGEGGVHGALPADMPSL